MNSENLEIRAKKIAPGGVHSPVRAFKSVGGHPLFFKSSQGAYIQSVEGKNYVDFCQSFGPNILGHRDADVSQVVEEMVQTSWSLGACEPYSLELGEWITQHLPWVENLRFVCSGTEAVMTALRLARAATGRTKTLKFEGCYHGHVDSMLVKAGSGLAGSGLTGSDLAGSGVTGQSASDSAGVSEEVALSTLIAPLDDELVLEKIFSEQGKDIAAIIIEPLPANFGLLIQRKEFIEKLVILARRHGSLVIFDEVISGFRVAMGGMAEVLGIKPDLVTYGKIIGGGFPVGAFGGRKDLMEQMAPQGAVYQAGTLAAQPIGMAAGLATLKKMEEQKVHQILAERTRDFCEELNAFWQNQSLSLQVSFVASLFWIHAKTNQPVRSLKDFSPQQDKIYNQVFHQCLDQGIYLAPSSYEVSFMSLAHDQDILQDVINKLKRVQIE